MLLLYWMVGRICLRRCIRLLLFTIFSKQSARSGTTTLLVYCHHSVASPSLQPLVTTTVEITGFSAESVDTYASQCLIQQGKDPAVFITALNDNHHARGLCSLPINTAILLHLFLTIQTGLPTTQTELVQLLHS